MAYRVAVDIGGTFTDLVVESEGGASVSASKVLTTPERLVDGVIAAVRSANVDPAELELFVHGTTAGLNSVLERRGAKVALVTTRGFRDTYLIGRGHRPQMYDLHYTKPRPLLEREAIFEVDERLSADGSELLPVDEASVRAVAREIAAAGFESVAVCLLHAYADGAHERRVGELLAETLRRARRPEPRRGPGLARVRAHRDDRALGLHHADHELLPRPALARPARRGRHGAGLRDRVQRRGHGRGGGRRKVGAHPVLGPGRRRRRHPRRGRGPRPRRPDLGGRRRHLVRRLDRARRRDGADGRVRAAGPARAGAGDRGAHDRRRRRLPDPLDRRRPARRARVGRSQPRPCLLRPRRHRADHHRREPGARPHPARPAPGRRAAAGPRSRARGARARERPPRPHARGAGRAGAGRHPLRDGRGDPRADGRAGPRPARLRALRLRRRRRPARHRAGRGARHRAGPGARPAGRVLGLGDAPRRHPPRRGADVLPPARDASTAICAARSTRCASRSRA